MLTLTHVYLPIFFGVIFPSAIHSLQWQNYENTNKIIYLTKIPQSSSSRSWWGSENGCEVRPTRSWTINTGKNIKGHSVIGPGSFGKISTANNITELRIFSSFLSNRAAMKNIKNEVVLLTKTYFFLKEIYWGWPVNADEALLISVESNEYTVYWQKQEAILRDMQFTMIFTMI